MARNASHYFLLSLLACLAINAEAAVDDMGVKVKWGYKGDISPSHWGQLSPDFALCSTGREQSPINISKQTQKLADGLKINYRDADKLTIVEDGTTDLTIKDKQYIVSDGHGVQLNFAKSEVKESIELDGKRYHLVQFHLHTPSETEMRGQSLPLEIHFVHQGEDGKVAVIAVLAKGGAENAELKKVIEHLPTDQHEEHLIEDERINPLGLLPTGRDHYRFAGSLTTPPCVEGLSWVVMKDTITASPAQIATLRKAMGGPNARPVQPLFDRVISLSSGKTS